MKSLVSLIVCGIFVFSIVAIALSQQPKTQAGPQLLFPSDYRQWVYLSSGLDMQYTGEPNFSCKDKAGKDGPCPKMFENVFVRREAYDGFVKNKIWPAGTIFILERRCSVQKASIDTSGSTQGKLFLIAASQKTKSAEHEGWNYYLFGSDAPLTCTGPDPDFSGQRHDPVSNCASETNPCNGETNPKMCWQCHRSNGLKDNTFIQFYPTLKPLVAAKKK
ncbi:MAG TPA: cytochrome P460 family protein [Candidatus Angelobacter sp.]|nr:cytochrome P460 family protein [Candidatus Angelobacter sp.]